MDAHTVFWWSFFLCMGLLVLLLARVFSRRKGDLCDLLVFGAVMLSALVAYTVGFALTMEDIPPEQRALARLVMMYG